MLYVPEFLTRCDPDTIGIAAPVFNESNEVLGSLVLVFSSSRTPWLSEAALVQIVVENAREISRRVASLAECPTNT